MPRPEDHPDPRTDRQSEPPAPPVERFEQALRRWAERPVPPPPAWPLAPSTRTALRRAAPRWRLVAATLAIAAAMVAGVLLHSRPAAPPATPTAAPQRAPAGAVVAALASPDEVLVLWLDTETPLYLTLPAAEEAADLERSNR